VKPDLDLAFYYYSNLYIFSCHDQITISFMMKTLYAYSVYANDQISLLKD